MLWKIDQLRLVFSFALFLGLLFYPERRNTLNFIYFNDKGRLKKHYIDDLYQGSNLTDKLYIFADFDLEDETVYTVSLMFGRKDGIKIGEVDGTRELNIINPATGTAMPAFTYLLGTDILKCAGELQISARYYYDFDVDGDGTLDQAIKGTAMVSATVNESVPTSNSQSTVLLNINRKITALQLLLDTHNHDDEYYLKAAADAKYATLIELDSTLNLKLKNEAGTILSSLQVPTMIMQTPPGTLVFNGTGTYIIDLNKRYVVIVIGSPTINLDVYKREESGETGQFTYTKLTLTPLLSTTINRTLEASLDPDVANDPFDGTYYISGSYLLDGVEDTFDAGYLDFGMINSYTSPALGLSSVGYFMVYEMEIA